MFDRFFRKLSAVVHHKAAPYAAERERFLEHCAQQGYTRDWIKKVAATLLVAAYELHTHGGLQANPEEIERALCALRHNGWPSLAACMCLPLALGPLPAWSTTSLNGWRRSEDFRRKRSKIDAGMSSASSRGSTSTVAMSLI
jgi:hypothetical protein